MGAIRGFLLVTVSTLLLLSMFSSLFLLTISSSLSYTTIEKEAQNLTKEFLYSNIDFSSAIDDAYPFMEIYCQNNSQYVFKQNEYTFTISCDKLSEGKDAMIDNGINNIVKEIYYKEYNCQFIKCFANGEIPLFLFSKMSYDFFYNLFTITLIVSILLSILGFFLVEKKNSLPILIGVLLVLCSLPFFKLNKILTLVPEKLIADIVGLFFSTSSSLALNCFIIGIILIVVGLILKLIMTANFARNLFVKHKEKKSEKEEKENKEKKKENGKNEPVVDKKVEEKKFK